jgi:hypothetical protein
VLLPIIVSEAKFELALPRGSANGPFQVRSGAVVSSSLGLVDSLASMPLDDFNHPAVTRFLHHRNGSQAL